LILPGQTCNHAFSRFRMLNYDLVTSKACYRLPRRDDMPILLQLAGRLAAERAAQAGAEAGAQERMLRTVQELSRHPDHGSIFLIEKGPDLVGYCVLVNLWSSELAGAVIRIDELFLEPDHRGQGIGEDFLELLAKVAPPGTCAIEMDAARDKESIRLCERAGFQGRSARIMSRRIGQDPAAGARPASVFDDA
jgi:GNAT superfamily N-acetyltransferase